MTQKFSHYETEVQKRLTLNRCHLASQRIFIISKDKYYSQNTRKQTPDMARPIELGLVLKGQDALDFEEYCRNPVVTERGIEIARKALDYLREHGNEL